MLENASVVNSVLCVLCEAIITSDDNNYSRSCNCFLEKCKRSFECEIK